MEFVFQNDRPIYIQMTEQLEVQIVSGQMAPGERLLSVREFAAGWKVNPNTVQRALAELEEKGLIYTERTNGKFVTNDVDLLRAYREKHAREKVERFLADMQELGYDREATVAYLEKQED